MNSTATLAFARLTSLEQNRNFRFRFETSIVSMSITLMCLEACERQRLQELAPETASPDHKHFALEEVLPIRRSRGKDVHAERALRRKQGFDP
jgi:hypothetical protein